MRIGIPFGIASIQETPTGGYGGAPPRVAAPGLDRTQPATEPPVVGRGPRQQPRPVFGPLDPLGPTRGIPGGQPGHQRRQVEREAGPRRAGHFAPSGFGSAAGAGVPAFTSATTPARIAGGRSGHAATTADRSGSAGVAGVGEPPQPASMLPDLLPPKGEDCDFSAESGGVFGPCIAHFDS